MKRNPSSNNLLVEQHSLPVNITTQTTTAVKSGPGVLHNIIINTPLANGVITIYDNTAGSGTVIGTITMPATLLTTGPFTVQYHAQFNTGLTIVTSGANQNITVTYA